MPKESDSESVRYRIEELNKKLSTLKDQRKGTNMMVYMRNSTFGNRDNSLYLIELEDIIKVKTLY